MYTEAVMKRGSTLNLKPHDALLDTNFDQLVLNVLDTNCIKAVIIPTDLKPQ